jgi:hypothetical protein
MLRAFSLKIPRMHEKKKKKLQKYNDIATSGFFAEFVDFYPSVMLMSYIFCIFFILFESLKTFQMVCLFT